MVLLYKHKLPGNRFLMDGYGLCVVHIMECVNIRGDDFACGYEAFQLHAERGGLIGSDENVTTEIVVKITVRAVTTSKNRGAVVTHVK
jgi:hypothetical protein